MCPLLTPPADDRSAAGRPRAGFTLIELIVVITILLAMAALTLMFLPTMQQQKVATGASQLHSWLQIARQRALRDQAPRGLRIVPELITTTSARIQAGNGVTVTPAAMNGTTAPANLPWSFQAGMYILVTDQVTNPNVEMTQVIKTGGNNFTAKFARNHPAAPPNVRPTIQPLVFATRAEYIEQPGDFFVTGASINSPNVNIKPVNGSQVIFTGVDFAGGNGIANRPLWPVQVGDYLEVNGRGLVHQITAITATAGNTLNTLTLANQVSTQATQAIAASPNSSTSFTVANPANIAVGCWLRLQPGSGQQEDVQVTGVAAGATGTTITVSSTARAHPVGSAITSHALISLAGNTNWRIIRAPRVVGDEQLQLPADVIIDLTTNGTFNQNNVNGLPIDPVTGNIDVLFAPDGRVIGRGTAADFFAFWVRDVNLKLFEGDNTLVAVYTRSGTVASHPADPKTNPASGAILDPYSFIKDGRSSGL